MKGFTASWKIFRTICIVQLILVAFKGMLSFSLLIYRGSILISCIDILAYGLVFLFVYHGLSMLNYNYPDTALSPRQKRLFNILYLINFLLISYLFAQVVNNWWMASFIFKAASFYEDKTYWLTTTALFIISWIIFLIHLAFLVGMFRLRRLIHENTISTWYEQFDQKP